MDSGVKAVLYDFQNAYGGIITGPPQCASKKVEVDALSTGDSRKPPKNAELNGKNSHPKDFNGCGIIQKTGILHDSRQPMPSFSIITIAGNWVMFLVEDEFMLPVVRLRLRRYGEVQC